MDRVFFFDFDSRAWSSRPTRDNLPGWTFAHATKRGRCVFALGSVQGEMGTLEVGFQAVHWPFSLPCWEGLKMTLVTSGTGHRLPDFGEYGASLPSWRMRS